MGRCRNHPGRLAYVLSLQTFDQKGEGQVGAHVGDTEAQVEDKLLSQVEITNLTMEPGRKKEEAKWRRIALNFLGSIADDG